MFNTTTSGGTEGGGGVLLWYTPATATAAALFVFVLVVVYYYYYYYLYFGMIIKVVNNNKPATSSSYYECCWTSSSSSTAPSIHYHHATTTTAGHTTLEEADAKYAQQLQLQEALLASSQTSTSKTAHNKPRSSSLTSSFLQNNIQPQMCRICLEKREYWQMFTNTTCSHSFCYDCTRKHATTKIQDKITTITCPELNCKSILDPNSLRLIVPKHFLIKWDQVLCESTILESHKFYCPFTDCSALLIHDDSTITQNNCPVCKRSICAVCHVPWHSEFTCKEFGKLNTKNKKGKKEYEKLAMALAKKNKWKKCPNCKFYVEKADGCVHITCRCKYEFCYDCGNKWSSSHGGCKPRS